MNNLHNALLPAPLWLLEISGLASGPQG